MFILHRFFGKLWQFWDRLFPEQVLTTPSPEVPARQVSLSPIQRGEGSSLSAPVATPTPQSAEVLAEPESTGATDSTTAAEEEGLPLPVNAVKNDLTEAARQAGEDGSTPETEVRSEESPAEPEPEPEKFLKILDLMRRTENVDFTAPDSTTRVKLRITGTGSHSDPVVVEINGYRKGTISREGLFSSSSGFYHERPIVVALLRELDSYPERTLRGSGRKTGVCAICGRRLTKPESIRRGMGPTCAARVGFRRSY